ncbi:MAG: hypothetical protein R2761_22945, partial [Acidimicrobiales bacterium]
MNERGSFSSSTLRPLAGAAPAGAGAVDALALPPAVRAEARLGASDDWRPEGAAATRGDVTTDALRPGGGVARLGTGAGPLAASDAVRLGRFD